MFIAICHPLLRPGWMVAGRYCCACREAQREAATRQPLPFAVFVSPKGTWWWIGNSASYRDDPELSLWLTQFWQPFMALLNPEYNGDQKVSIRLNLAQRQEHKQGREEFNKKGYNWNMVRRHCRLYWWVEMDQMGNEEVAQQIANVQCHSWKTVHG